MNEEIEQLIKENEVKIHQLQAEVNKRTQELQAADGAWMNYSGQLATLQNQNIQLRAINGKETEETP